MLASDVFVGEGLSAVLEDSYFSIVVFDPNVEISRGQKRMNEMNLL